MEHTAGLMGRVVACLAAVLVLGSCGSDDESSSTQPSVESTVAPTIASTTAPTTADSTDATPAAEAVDALTGAEICELVTGDIVGEALGIEVTEAVADDSSTPQCAYRYTSADGASSNVTVAAMRSTEDLGGRLGQEAFDYVVDLNKSLASGTDVEELHVSAGDGAVVLAGESINLGVINVGGRVITLIVPTANATAPTVEALVIATATALS